MCLKAVRREGLAWGLLRLEEGLEKETQGLSAGRELREVSFQAGLEGRFGGLRGPVISWPWGSLILRAHLLG